MARSGDELTRYTSAITSIERIQKFDPETLPRTQQLGEAINFKAAVEPATRIIDLYRQIPVDVLESMPTQRVAKIGAQSDTDYTYLKQILDFEAGTPRANRDSLLTQLENAYAPTWEALHPIISYSVRKSTDFTRLERDGRAAIQSVRDEADAIQEGIRRMKAEAESALDAIRKVAAEQGVSQQAIYFKSESDEHATEAKAWLKRTVWLTVVLAIYAVSTLFLHKVVFLAPTNAYETIQLSVSKVLVFATISFFLLLAAKNYNAHRHNAVVNKHRQNALVTYEALVRAAGDSANRDIVLTKAADCIFSPQGTGYTKSDGSESGQGSVSLVSVAPGALRATAS